MVRGSHSLPPLYVTPAETADSFARNSLRRRPTGRLEADVLEQLSTPIYSTCFISQQKVTDQYKEQREVKYTHGCCEEVKHFHQILFNQETLRTAVVF